MSSRRSICDFGTVYSTFGPETLAFLEQARTWTDPCGEVTEEGMCQGRLARVCETSLVGNIRRLIERDRAAVGQQCVASEGGVSCGTTAVSVTAAPDDSREPLPGAAAELVERAREGFQPDLLEQAPGLAATAPAPADRSDPRGGRSERPPRALCRATSAVSSSDRFGEDGSADLRGRTLRMTPAYAGPGLARADSSQEDMTLTIAKSHLARIGATPRR